MKWALFFLTPLLCFGLSVKEQFVAGNAGDYIVFEKDKMCTLFHLHTKDEHTLTIEEISLPSYKKPKDFKAWVASGGMNSSSWNMYEIDLDSGRILEGYSFSKKAFFTPTPFLSNLMALSLETWKGRRRIGPPPTLGDFDGRKLWNPPYVFEGKKAKRKHMEAFIATWPKDDSPLSSQNLTLYFADNFPFPYWLEINDPSYTYKLRAIDSGKEMISPYEILPRQSLQIIGNVRLSPNNCYLLFKTPSYFKEFDLIAVDAKTGEHTTLPHTLTTGTLSQINFDFDQLKRERAYTFIISPKSYPGAYAETYQPVVNNQLSPSQ
ncbi:MAG: hypothetical protein SP1CHLAM54_03890 [Chlamydiia bacterium]|nr:hypothetical protein [Chlamydiia bacterium]MCH9615304.1 hypothetical protein [Chlamydiia bacterium]MCH9628374.1 hypothetical protein [Chlamydiia bacterium]